MDGKIKTPTGRWAKDLAGMRFGCLVAIRIAEPYSTKHGLMWVCKCDCGKEVVCITGSLNHGGNRSCGCGISRVLRGESAGRIASIWRSMIARCYKKTVGAYKWYGALGVTVCNEWRCDYFKFKEWAINNGYDKHLTLDRINSHGNYEPLNCKWATWKEQANNKRSTPTYERNGIIKPIAQWAADFSLSKDAVFQRIRVLGWSIEKAITTPTAPHYAKRHKKKKHNK